MTHYQEILRLALRLTPEEQLMLSQELLANARQRVIAKPPANIMELRGLGKEIWTQKEIDAQEYVDRERDSWNG